MIQYLRGRLPAPDIKRRLLPLALLTVLAAGCSAVGPPAWPGMSVHEGTVYLAQNTAIYAIDLTSGAERWRYVDETRRGATFYAPPAAGEGLVIAGGYNGTVYALDALRGTEVWVRPDLGGQVIGGPIIVGDQVLVTTSAGRVHALNLAGGTERWVFPEDGPLEHPIWSSPAVASGMVYVSAMDHFLYALDLATGEASWKADLGGGSVDQPTVVEDVILAGSFNRQLLAIDQQSGSLRWSLDTLGWVWGNPVVSDGVAYVGDLEGGIYAVEVSSGESVWPAGEKLDGPVAATPALGSQTVFFVTEAGSIYARQAADNLPLWKQSLEGELLGDPLVIDGILLVPIQGQEALLAGYDAESGVLRWTFTPAE